MVQAMDVSVMTISLVFPWGREFNHDLVYISGAMVILNWDVVRSACAV